MPRPQDSRPTTPVARALWFIESHFDEELTLDAIARVSGVSRFHLARAFGAACGLSIMRYVRGRRLSRAARRLADGAPDILAVALDAGYGSHEAFTRAFREQFGHTPEAVRERARIDHLPLTEPIAMSHPPIPLDPPRFVTPPPARVAGLGGRHSWDDKAGIPSQWQQAVPAFAVALGRVPAVTYGVAHDADDAGNFDYLCGVEVTVSSAVPADWTCVDLPAQCHAVFTHRGHVSGIDGAFATIWNHWLPQSGRILARGPVIERYDPRFDPISGAGECEIWVPVR